MSSDFARPTAEELSAAASISASTIHEATGKIGALPAAIKPLNPAIRVCGPAFTVRGAPGDNLWLHYALAEAQPGTAQQLEQRLEAWIQEKMDRNGLSEDPLIAHGITLGMQWQKWLEEQG